MLLDIELQTMAEEYVENKLRNMTTGDNPFDRKANPAIVAMMQEDALDMLKHLHASCS